MEVILYVNINRKKKTIKFFSLRFLKKFEFLIQKNLTDF